MSTDVMVCIVAFLDCNNLVDLALTCRKLGARMPQSGLDWSSVEEATRQLLGKDMAYCEKSALPRSREHTWMAICHELEMLRRPLIFDLLMGSNGYDVRYDGYGGDRKSAILVDCFRGYALGISNHVMRAGKHFATLTCTQGGFESSIKFGVTRAVNYPYNMNIENWGDLLSKRTDNWGNGNVNMCLYSVGDSACNWTDWTKAQRCDCSDWRINANFDVARGEGECKFGLLLDLDEGTLTVYKGRMRCLVKGGLTGEYCWVAEAFDTAVNRPRIKIQREHLPPSEL